MSATLPPLTVSALARCDALLLGVLPCRLLDHGAHERLIGGDPVGDHVPLLAVPLHELHRAAALVIEARDLERVHEPDGADLLQPGVVDPEVLDAPADLLAGERLLA